MKLSWVEEMTLSLARGATGKAGDGQMLTLLVVALLAGTCLRARVDLGLVVSAACLLGVLSVLERRQVAEIIRRLRQEQRGSTRATVPPEARTRTAI